MIGPQFELEAFDAEPVHRLVLRGEIDVKTAPQLESALSDATGQTVLVDLSDVTFIDSTGLRVLAMERARFESEDRQLVVCAPDDSVVLRTMRLAGLAGDFRVVTDPADLTETE